ncbi:MAG: hypothetical protein II830_00705 [Alphaproteobacteria bacterium]|nr:hypothetical protein [Alphaproteobacteria bacterium]
MKDFFITLLKGIGIALAVSLIVCFFAWYWGNWRAIIWFAVIAIICWQVWKYLTEDTWISKPTMAGGKVEEHKYREPLSYKIEELVIGAAFFLLGGGFFWGIGWVAEWILNKPSAIFEHTILNEILSVFMLSSCWWTIRITYCAIREFDWKFQLSLLLALLKWILIVGISVAVGLVVLHYGLPPVQ